MFVKHDEKKNSVLIEVSPQQLATLVAALGVTSDEDLWKSQNVKREHMAMNYPLFRPLDKVYYKLRDKGVY
ncbi:hypothetical protein P4261_28235 [Bacillus thuringiensis]|nr:hypothetical protein [Bacillus thuringiensis]MED2829772.1 hypothetical protein [Bacillus thuringiensis]MED2856368.1 hypothetical protein [Bacillus thuringiensis]MED2863828.1 hypothetical protein [Bacillus thuringiensis]